MIGSVNAFIVWPRTETCANFGYDWCVHLVCNVAEYYIYFALFSLVISPSSRGNCADISVMGQGVARERELFFKWSSTEAPNFYVTAIDGLIISQFA